VGASGPIEHRVVSLKEDHNRKPQFAYIDPGSGMRAPMAAYLSSSWSLKSAGNISSDSAEKYPSALFELGVDAN
jgi:hypothetical protein